MLGPSLYFLSTPLAVGYGLHARRSGPRWAAVLGLGLGGLAFLLLLANVALMLLAVWHSY